MLQLAFFANVALFAQQGGMPPPTVPQARQAEPKTAKPGTVVKITGVLLGKSRVDEVFLTDHRFDLKVKVIEQTDQSLTIRIPPFVKAGRQQLLFLTGGQNPAYLEQPLYILVEADEDAITKSDTPAKSVTAPAAGDKNNDKPDQF